MGKFILFYLFNCHIFVRGICLAEVEQKITQRNGVDQFLLCQFFYKACSDRRYRHIADDVIQNKMLWQPFWESTHLRCW